MTSPTMLSVTVGAPLTLALALVQHAGTDPLRWLVAFLGAAVLVFAVWCAPLARAGTVAGTIFSAWDPRWGGAKTSQLVAGAVATAALALLRIVDPGYALILGVVVAIIVGLSLPAPGAPAGAHSGDADRT